MFEGRAFGKRPPDKPRSNPLTLKIVDFNMVMTVYKMQVNISKLDRKDARYTAPILFKYGKASFFWPSAFLQLIF